MDTEDLQSLSDKRKLPWPELSSSNHSVSQFNQKIKTECLSQRVPNIDGGAVDQKPVGMCYTLPEVSKISSRSILVKKENSSLHEGLPMAYPLPPCNVQSDFDVVTNTGANFGVKTEVINLEEDGFEPR